MCCHNGHGAKQVLTALRSVDSSITEKDSAFWHKTLGAQGGGTAKADPEAAMAAVDAAWLAATKNNKDWSKMTPQERLDAQAQFRSLRLHVEDGEISLTENQVLKLGSYVTKRKTMPRVTRIGTVAAGVLVAMGAMTGSAAHADAATLPQPAPIAANTQNANLLHMPVGKDGMCAADFTLAKAGKTHKVSWKSPTGKVSKGHVLKKGAKACIFTGKDGKTVAASTAADGTITALPSNFPKNPTAADISSLGLSRDSKVAGNVLLPQPKGAPLVAPQLAQKIKPLGVQKVTTETVETGAGPVQKQVAWVEWEVTGGQGALTYGSRDASGSPQYQHSVALNPNGSIRVVQPVAIASGSTDGSGITSVNFQGYVVPDYGQTKVPSSMTRDWDFSDARAQDSSGRGYTAGIHSNSANPSYVRNDGSRDDGFVRFDAAMNMVGDYNY